MNCQISRIDLLHKSEKPLSCPPRNSRWSKIYSPRFGGIDSAAGRSPGGQFE